MEQMSHKRALSQRNKCGTPYFILHLIFGLAASVLHNSVTGLGLEL